MESSFDERESTSETVVGANRDTPGSGASIFAEPSRVGRHQLIYRIGSGGMATVYVGRLSGLAGFERLVAVKVIHQHLAKSQKFVDMFLDEARVAASIHHPNVAEIYEVGKDRDIFFMVGEFVHGQDLGKILRRADELNRPLSRGMLAQVGAQICFGLHAAHETRDKDGKRLNLIHRDISPNNILISYSGYVKIIDFGVAWASNRLAHTESGALKGKVGYVAPEQITGQPLDRRSDVFSAGVMQYIMATMTHPFPGNSDAERLQRIVTGDVTPPREVDPSVPEALEHIIMKAMATSPDDRFNTAAEMGQALEAFAESTKEEIKAEHVSAAVSGLFESEAEEHQTRINLYREVNPDSDMDFDSSAEIRNTTQEVMNDVLLNAAVKRATWRNMWFFTALALMVLGLAVAVFFLYKDREERKATNTTPVDMTSEVKTDPTQQGSALSKDKASSGSSAGSVTGSGEASSTMTPSGASEASSSQTSADTEKTPGKGNVGKRRRGGSKKSGPSLIQNPYQLD